MDQFKRPKIHIAKTKTEWAADLVGYFALAAIIELHKKYYKYTIYL